VKMPFFVFFTKKTKIFRFSVKEILIFPTRMHIIGKIRDFLQIVFQDTHSPGPVMSSIISIPFQQKLQHSSQFGPSASKDDSSELELQPHPFLAGPENYVVCSAVYDIIQETPNPFLIIFCAPSGSGKTHLSEGLLLSWFARHPNGPGLCIPALEFSREWANAQRTRTPHEFFEKYQILEFVILEDIQEISTHPATQDQLVRLLDIWNRNQTRVLLTGNQPFSLLPLNEKLISRLRQGVTIPIQLPSTEVRGGILALPEHSQNISIPQTVLEEFVEQSDQQELTVGEMLQRFQKLVWSRKIAPEQGKTGIIPPQTQNNLLTDSAEDTQITIAQIAKLAAKFYKIRLSDLRSKSRKMTLVTVRDIIYFMARRMTNATLDEIGLYFNGRDHTTILHGCAQAEILIRTNDEVKRCVDYLHSELRLLQKQARYQQPASTSNPFPPRNQENETLSPETSGSLKGTRKYSRPKSSVNETGSESWNNAESLESIETPAQNSLSSSTLSPAIKKAGSKRTSQAKKQKKKD